MEWALMSDTSLQVHLISVWPSMSIENLFILKSDTSLLRLNTHYMCLPTMFTGHEHKWWTRVTLLTPMFTIRVISMTHDIILTVTADDKCRLKTASVTITDSDWWVYQKRKGCCYWLLQWIMSRRPLPVLRKISGIFWMVSRTPTQAVYMGVQYTLSMSSACVGKKHCTTMFFWHSPCACAWRHSQAHAQYTPPVNTVTRAVFTGEKRHPCSRPMSMIREHGPRTQVVCIDLWALYLCCHNVFCLLIT